MKRQTRPICERGIDKLTRASTRCRALVAIVWLAVACSSPLVYTPGPPDLDRESQSVAYGWWGGPCPPDNDCDGFIQLLTDGTLRLNRSGEYPPIAYSARVSDSELATVMALAEDADLVTFLESREKCPHPLPTDGGSWIYVKTDVVTGERFPCNEAALTLTQALTSLRVKYFGEW
jgi:hypothetical protein